MTTLRATLDLYLDTARDTGRSLSRSGLALLVLFLATPVLIVASMLASPLGMIGGFLVGFLHAALVGWYLALVEVTVLGSRRLVLRDLRSTFGTYLWEVISVLFIFWIASMLLMRADPAVVTGLTLLATILFNPVPELVYQGRTRSLALLQAALKFVQDNWPEWLAVHVAAWGVLGLWGWMVSGDMLGLATGVIQLFGPWFGFISVGSLAIGQASMGPVGIASAVFLLVFAHAFMVFRGHLYRRLSRGSRRSRAWRARMR